MRTDHLAAEEHAGHVDLETAPPEVEGIVFEAGRLEGGDRVLDHIVDCGVVDQHIDLSEYIDRAHEQGADGMRIGDVGAEAERRAAVLGLERHGEFLGGLVVEVGGDHMRSGTSQRVTVLSANEPQGTGDDGDSVVETEGARRVSE